MNYRKFASVMVYNSFRRLYRAISVRTKGFQSLAKFIKSSEVNQLQVFEQKTGLSTKDNPLQRAIQPALRRAIQPLRRDIKPLWRKQDKPLRRNDQPLVWKNEAQQFTRPVAVHKQSNYSIIHLKRTYTIAILHVIQTFVYCT